MHSATIRKDNRDVKRLWKGVVVVEEVVEVRCFLFVGTCVFPLPFMFRFHPSAGSIRHNMPVIPL